MESMPLWAWSTSTTPPLKNNFYLNKGAVIRSSSSEYEKETSSVLTLDMELRSPSQTRRLTRGLKDREQL